jgi:hypothetical protein
MPTQPIRATPGGGGWIRDSSGMMAPVGNASSAKELMQLPKEMRDIALAANTLIRGKFTKELWPDLAMLNAIAPRHRLTQVFIASVTAGSMAENGQATANFLQGIVNMLVPSAMSPYNALPASKRRDGYRTSKNRDNKVADEDNE